MNTKPKTNTIKARIDFLLSSMNFTSYKIKNVGSVYISPQQKPLVIIMSKGFYQHTYKQKQTLHTSKKF